jgi:hypothetical protein
MTHSAVWHLAKRPSLNGHVAELPAHHGIAEIAGRQVTRAAERDSGSTSYVNEKWADGLAFA